MAETSLDERRPILRRRLYELVAEQVLEDISSGRLKPGENLPPASHSRARFSRRGRTGRAAPVSGSLRTWSGETNSRGPRGRTPARVTGPLSPRPSIDSIR